MPTAGPTIGARPTATIQTSHHPLSGRPSSWKRESLLLMKILSCRIFKLGLQRPKCSLTIRRKVNNATRTPVTHSVHRKSVRTDPIASGLHSQDEKQRVHCKSARTDPIGRLPNGAGQAASNDAVCEKREQTNPIPGTALSLQCLSVKDIANEIEGSSRTRSARVHSHVVRSVNRQADGRRAESWGKGASAAELSLRGGGRPVKISDSKSRKANAGTELVWS